MRNIILLACLVTALVQEYHGRRAVIGALEELSHHEFIKRAGSDSRLVYLDQRTRMMRKRFLDTCPWIILFPKATKPNDCR
ncbi:hypothetical protein EV702DRAFT_1143363 [Suillus placidus]|uniref:Uncharacterized protein n=1 Tax=Suillus placidus TaxID=48579 RepID=A0A9P6ZJG3_9AGAM|nr:hypothetical protein EV702DRAFT_1143363 [Suillus placidus]